MNEVQVEQKDYQMPPREGFTVAHFLTVADVERSARFYETVFGGRVVRNTDRPGEPTYVQLANTWLIVNATEFARRINRKPASISRDLAGGLSSAKLGRVREMANAAGYDVVAVLVPQDPVERRKTLAKVSKRLGR